MKILDWLVSLFSEEGGKSTGDGNFATLKFHDVNPNFADLVFE